MMMTRITTVMIIHFLFFFKKKIKINEKKKKISFSKKKKKKKKKWKLKRKIYFLSVSSFWINGLCSSKSLFILSNAPIYMFVGQSFTFCLLTQQFLSFFSIFQQKPKKKSEKKRMKWMKLLKKHQESFTCFTSININKQMIAMRIIINEINNKRYGQDCPCLFILCSIGLFYFCFFVRFKSIWKNENKKTEIIETSINQWIKNQK